MSTRIMVATPIAALALAFALGSPALAADPDPIVTFTGTIAVTSDFDGETREFPATVSVDCTTRPCLLRATIDTDGVIVRLTGDDGFPLTGATTTGTLPTTGDICNDDSSPGGAVTVVVDEDTLTLSLVSVGSGQTDCPDGSTIQFDGFQAVLTATAAPGAACVIVGCGTATPTAVPTAIAAEPRPDDVSPRTASTPGVLSTLPTVAEALTPANLIWAATLTVVLALLVAFPSALLTEAAGKGTERVGAWWARVRSRVTAAPRPAWTSRGGGWPVALGSIGVAALLSSFIDPDFGFTVQGLRIFASVLLSLAVDVVIGWVIVIAIMGRTRPDAAPTVRVVPATLAIVALAVLFSRLTGFEPGIIFGLVAGVAFGATLATADRARVILLGLGWSFIAALVGWAGYSLLAPVVGDSPEPLGVFALETLSAMAVGGIAALPIALLPVRGLAGHEVFRWNRPAWGAAYAVGLLGFFVVLMPVPFSWETVELSIWVWVGAYLAYAIVAVGLWLGFARPWEKDRPQGEVGD